ncbi:helix-turn-helix domain-containing protein [Nocardia sp. NPDC049220]|uniref:helix-turn-helix domain-containing protein n=1 Tax=Nocardia sp. NPDC049220 TaxID=3155273 RepID=UPI003407BE78
MSKFDQLLTTADDHPVVVIVATGTALAVAVGAVVAARLITRWVHGRGVTGEQAGTLMAAGIATGVSTQGMWVFFDESLHLTLSLRIMFFAFLEIMVLTSALRARTAQRQGGSAGVDGIAMWVLTCLSAILAATDADNLGTLLVRLTAPLVAAWGWERSMALERQRSGNLSGVNWRITPERILIRLGLADPTDRTASEAAAQRRLIDVALAADYARTLREAGARPWRINRAKQKLQKSMRRAIEDGGLVVEHGRDRQAVLLDNIRVLSGASALLELDLPNPWLPTPAADAADPASGQVSADPQSVEPLPITQPDLPTQQPDPSTAAPPEHAAAEDSDRHPARTGRQVRRDPAVRARVLELRAAEKPATEIAADLDISPRTIGRILADLAAESADLPADLPDRQATHDAATDPAASWPNGLRILAGGTTGHPAPPADDGEAILDAELIDDDQYVLAQQPHTGDEAAGVVER